MAQQCFRSLGTKLPMSPLSQSIGGSGIMLKPTMTIWPSDSFTLKPVSRLPTLTIEDQIAIHNSSWRSPHNRRFVELSPYAVKAVDSSLIGCSREIGVVNYYFQSFNEKKGSIVSCTGAATEKSGASASGASASGAQPPKSDDTGPEKPNQDQLQRIHDVITNSLLKLFTTPMDYSVYNKDIVFVDNIRNRTTHGILRYVQQVAFLRAIGHFKFAFVKFEILNTNISTEDSRITVRWRINGISGMRVMLKFWKYRLWDWKEIMTSQERWYDGISYFDVGTDGLVFRHIADKMMEDKGPQVVDVNKAALAAKLGVLASLFPQPTSLAFSKKVDGSSHLYDIQNSGLQPM